MLDFAGRARRIDVSKRRARHTLPQAEIGALLVREARAGHAVVRLKGGDPFIFGRGGEEVAACLAAGVTVSVVPGVSAALGAAAAAQMPLTHRDHSSVVSFVAGQCKGLSDQNWAGLAGPGRTLVIYMGLSAADAIADKLMADGLSPETPCAVLERGTLGGSRVLRTLLADLGGLVARADVVSPALLASRRGDAAGHRRQRARTTDRGACRVIRLLTANDTLTGDVLWWTGGGWSLALADAVAVGDDAEALLAAVIAAEEVNDPDLIDAEPGPPPRPRTMRERIRGYGPTVRRDLARPGAPVPDGMQT